MHSRKQSGRGALGLTVDTVLKAPVRIGRTAIATLLAKVEAQVLKRPLAPHFPPLFIIGLPRVGSTLVYQALVRRFAVSYLCNAAAAYPSSPGIVTTLLCRFRRVLPGDAYSSHYGYVPGWSSPSQGREMWARWFPVDQSFVGPGLIDGAAAREMRGTVARIESAFGLPFVNKAQGHAVRMEALCEVFPGALFVRVNREPLPVAESILQGRRECFGDATHWFSMKPSAYRDLVDCDPFWQIAGQIHGVNADMQRAAARIGSHRVIEVNYEDFCSSPGTCLDRIGDFYAHSGGPTLRIRGEVPTSFLASRLARVPSTDSLRLKVCLQESGLVHSTSSPAL